jgi:hypothetical protein
MSIATDALVQELKARIEKLENEVTGLRQLFDNAPLPVPRETNSSKDKRAR